ncbi:MAG: site-specific integrase [Eubacteriales bacterium]
MWIEKLQNGKFKCVERYTDYITGKEKKVSVTINKDTRVTRKAAEEALRIKIDSKQTVVCNENISLSQLIQLYLEHQKLTVKASTFKRNYFACQSILKILQPDTIVNKLTAGYIRSKLLHTKRDNSTLNGWLTRFKALINWGYQNDYVDDNRYLDKLTPFDDVSARAKIQDKYLEREQLELLISNMKVKHWQMVTKIMALSGLRIGELIALNMDDLDFDSRYIIISKTYDPTNKIINTAKTFTSHRSVYMQDELYVYLKEIKSLMLQQRLRHGYKNTKLFLCDIKGDYISYYSYNKYLKENGVLILDKEKVTTHILRHTHVCLMAEQNISLEVISRRLGHHDTKITREVYFHVTNRLKEKDNAEIESIHLLSV